MHGCYLTHMVARHSESCLGLRDIWLTALSSAPSTTLHSYQHDSLPQPVCSSLFLSRYLYLFAYRCPFSLPLVPQDSPLPPGVQRQLLQCFRTRPTNLALPTANPADSSSCSGRLQAHPSGWKPPPVRPTILTIAQDRADDRRHLIALTFRLITAVASSRTLRLLRLCALQIPRPSQMTNCFRRVALRA